MPLYTKIPKEESLLIPQKYPLKAPQKELDTDKREGNNPIAKMGSEIRFHPVQWKSKVTQKKDSFKMTINKMIADGFNMQKGDILHSYLGEDMEQRPIIITYLDGNPNIFLNKKLAKSEDKK
ncbi:MAG: hypothetical protein V1859_10040 [archaeon]